MLHPRIAGKYGIQVTDAQAFATRLRDEGLLFEDPRDPPRVVPNDVKDDYLVALALAAKADALVTRDRHFEKVRVRGLPILSARDFLRRIPKP